MVKIGLVKFDVNKVFKKLEKYINVQNGFARFTCLFQETFYYSDSVEGKIRMINDIGDGKNKYGKNSWNNIGYDGDSNDEQGKVNTVNSHYFFKFMVAVNARILEFMNKFR